MESVLVFARRHATLVFGIAIVAALSGILLVSRVSFDANILRLLPQRSPSVRDFELSFSNFGSLDHLYVVFNSARRHWRPRRARGSLRRGAAARARRSSRSTPSSSNPARTGPTSPTASSICSAPTARPRRWPRFRSPQLERELAHARDLLSMPSAQMKALVQQDPLGLLTMLRDRMSREKGFVSFDPTQEGYVSPDGRSRLIIVKPKGRAVRHRFLQGALPAVVRGRSHRATGSGGGRSDAGAVEIQAAGAYRVSLEAEQLIRREGIANSIGSLLLLLLVVFAVFRTPWVMLVRLRAARAGGGADARHQRTDSRQPVAGHERIGRHAVRTRHRRGRADVPALPRRASNGRVSGRRRSDAWAARPPASCWRR